MIQTLTKRTNQRPSFEQYYPGYVQTHTKRSVEKIRVLLADDFEIVRVGMRVMLQTQPDVQVVGAASDGQEAIELAQKLHPDVVIMDINMPKMDGIMATERIKAEMPNIRIIGLSCTPEPMNVINMLKAGASFCLEKAGSPNKLLAAIRNCSGTPANK